ncbi:MAG: SpoIIE family protein phosphatase [Phycisphaerales bacterium]
MRDAGATTTLLVARSRLVSADPEAVIEPIRAAWPGAAPKVEVIALEELLESPRKAAARANAVIALLGEDESNALVYRLEDALGVATRPAIVLRDTPEGSPKPRDADGVLVEPMHADPVYLANALSALMRRQPMIDRLAGELNIAQASLGGVQGQVTRWQDEMQLAASVQREFFPKKTPTPDGLDVGVIFRPAGYVSGDIWDVEQVDEHRTAFFIADAVGHGVPAALLTLVIARSIRKTEGVGADRRVLSPAETLTRLNLEFSERLTDRSRFATAVYGVFDARSNTVTLAGAGHPVADPVAARADRADRDGGAAAGGVPGGRVQRGRVRDGHGRRARAVQRRVRDGVPGPRVGGAGRASADADVSGQAGRGGRGRVQARAIRAPSGGSVGRAGGVAAPVGRRDGNPDRPDAGVRGGSGGVTENPAHSGGVSGR